MLEKINIVEKKRQQENKLVLEPIKKWLAKTLEAKSYVFYKNWGGGFGRGGRPDIEVTYKGIVSYFELKDENGDTSPLQKEVIKAYGLAGKIVYVVDNLDDFIKIWNSIHG